MFLSGILLVYRLLANRRRLFAYQKLNRRPDRLESWPARLATWKTLDTGTGQGWRARVNQVSIRSFPSAASRNCTF